MHAFPVFFLALLSASFQAAAPTPSVTARDACNFPPEVTRLAPTYVSQSFGNTFPGTRKAVVAVTIDSNGRVLDARIKDSAPEPFMNRGAIEAAKNSVYAP